MMCTSHISAYQVYENNSDPQPTPLTYQRLGNGRSYQDLDESIELQADT